MKRQLGWVFAALVIIGCGGRYHRDATSVSTSATDTTGTDSTNTTGTTDGTTNTTGTTGTTGTSGELVYAVGTNNRLVTFNTSAPATLITDGAISGPDSSDPIVALDYDAAGSTVYAMSQKGALYRLVDFGISFVAFPVGTADIGTNSKVIDIDVDPVSRNIRVVLDAGGNLVVDRDSGSVVSLDGNFAYSGAGFAYPNGIAYAPTGAAVPFYAFAGYDQLVRSANPSANSLEFYNTDAHLPTTGNVYGLDIDASGQAILSVDGANASTLVTVNAATGVGQSIGTTANGLHIRSLCFGPTVQAQ